MYWHISRSGTETYLEPCQISAVELFLQNSAKKDEVPVTTVNDWKSVIVGTKMPILVAFGCLDSPLCEIKMSELNKQHISQTRYY